MKAVVFTLGCKVNECESDSLIAGLVERGYDVSDKLEYADIYIVNTCAVTSEAEKKSRQMTTRIRKLNPNAKIIYTGCACQNDPKAFSKKSDNFLVTGVFNKNKILDMLDLCGEVIAPESVEFEELLPVKTLRTRAYVKVQDGCNNFCSYCLIPYLRGRSRSRSPENIVNEINSLTAKEVVINGINLSSYSYNGKKLFGLIQMLKDCDKRIRLGSLEARVISHELLRALKDLKDFAPHFHLSLQSGSDNVLKKMNRRYTISEFEQKVQLIREYFPLAGITTDVIAGFPEESEEDFIDSLEFIKQVEFSDIHPFIFSPRQGTVAYKMKDLPHSIKKERLDKLLEVKAQLKEKFINKNIERIHDCIIEEFKDGYYQGYTGNYIRVFVKEDVEQNQKVKLKLEKSFDTGAIASKI